MVTIAVRATSRHNFYAIAFLASVVFVLSLVAWPGGGSDFAADIRPGAAHWLKPWEQGMPQAPYVSLLLHPLSYFSAGLGTALVNAACIVVVSLVLAKYKAPLWTIYPILISPVGYYEFRCGQTDWLPLVGLLVAGGTDLILFTCKPQVALWASVTRLGKRSVAMALGFFALSLVVWGLWPMKLREFSFLTDVAWNSSLWPYSVPLGIGLVYLAWRKGDELLGVAASPLLFPYVNMASYLGAAVVLAVKYPKWLAFSWVTMWIVGLAFLLL